MPTLTTGTGWAASLMINAMRGLNGCASAGPALVAESTRTTAPTLAVTARNRTIRFMSNLASLACITNRRRR